MATVISLTEEKIQELLSGWEALGLTQEQINALVIQLRDSQQQNNSALTELVAITLPKLQNDLTESSNRVSELSGTVVADLIRDVERNAAEVQDFKEITIPGLREDVQAANQNVADRPKVFVQDTEPEEYDDLEDRYLVAGDVWYNSAKTNEQKIWDGTKWTSFAIDIADFSLTVRKFQTNTHMIY